MRYVIESLAYFAAGLVAAYVGVHGVRQARRNARTRR